MKELGKITHTDFDEIFTNKLGYKRKEVATGASFGIDVSVIDLPNNMAMALTSDPLSLIPTLGLQESAWLSVHLMANDMATTGFAPMYGQFVLNLPPALTTDDFKIYWNYIHQFCADIKLTITGGHTGSIEGQNSTIAGGGTMITVAEKNKILVSKNANEGDVILVTKQCAISSVAILAMSFPNTVKTKLGNEIYNDACELFYKTSSLQDALTAVQLNETNNIVTAMHDVTEGGVLGAVYEMAIASGNGVLIEDNKMPISNTQQEVCNLFSLNPRNCIGAGSMVITVKKGFEEKLIALLKERNIQCSAIGEMVNNVKGMNSIDINGEVKPLIYLNKDPYWDAFFTALKNNWN